MTEVGDVSIDVQVLSLADIQRIKRQHHGWTKESGLYQ